MKTGQLIYYNADGVTLRPPSVTGTVWRRPGLRPPVARELDYWILGLFIVTITALFSGTVLGLVIGLVFGFDQTSRVYGLIWLSAILFSVPVLLICMRYVEQEKRRDESA